MKKIISILLLISIIITLIGCGSENGKVEETRETKEVVEEEVEEVTNDDWEDMKENIVGKSDKDYKEVTERKPRNVRNDTTKKWKITTISENVDLVEYANSYRKLYMKDGDVHFIINFNYKTTTKLNYLGSLLYVDITEYEDKEEHNANDLGSGMPLKNYIIYPDGDIEERGD